MATARLRHVSALTVSDEHGKGAEVLRQAVASHWEPISAGSGITSHHHILYCEVDMIIRYLRYMSVDICDADADLTVYRNRLGTLTALAAAHAYDTDTTEIFVEATLTLAVNGLRKNDSVYALMLRATASTESGDWGVYFGWMPDTISLDSDFRSY